MRAAGNHQEEEAAVGGIKVVRKLSRLHMLHLGGGHREKEAEEGKPPKKGWMAVRVGPEGEEQRRFVVPVACLSHPLFAELLEEAAAEYGYEHTGPIVIPCAVGHFSHVVHDVIEDGYLHKRHRPHLFTCFAAEEGLAVSLYIPCFHPC